MAKLTTQIGWLCKKYFGLQTVFVIAVLALSLLQILGSIALPGFIFVISYTVFLALWIGNYFSIKHRNEVTQENVEDILHDPLTHLPSYALFLEHINHNLQIAKRHEKYMAVIILDIDKFAEVNHYYGYEAGDTLLKNVASRLTEVIRDCDTISRISGDEFALVVNYIEQSSEIDKIVNRLTNELNVVYQVEDEAIQLKISYGICVYPKDERTADKLVHFAGLALASAKSAGGNTHHYYNDKMNSDASARISEELNLRLALERNEFRLFFQPKVDSATGDIKGMEALIRWEHPVRGMVSPLEFIPLLEESGMIVEVGDWVLRESCKINKQWQDMGLQPLCVSVNVSSIQFKQKDFIDSLQQALDEAGLEPKYLEIELTESCLMDDVTNNITLLQQIKEKNISISVDDFGTGYSSLSYLKRFPIDTLKIDRSFITNVQNRKDNDNAAIVTAIMALSHSLRLNVVAEGVETAQELSYLHALGCKTIQGFLFSKPLSVDEFTQLQQDSLRMKGVIDTVRAELAS